MLNAARVRRDVVVIGGSAGGVESLIELVGKLPAEFEAAGAVVLHMNPLRRSQLAAVLARLAPITVEQAQHGVAFRRRHLYVAVPDHHLLVGPTLSLTRDPKEHFHRPAIDPLFRSAAAAFGSRVVGILVSGSTSDGVSGAVEIRNAGGLVLVEDRATARHPRLPATAMAEVGADAEASIDELASMLPRLAVGEAIEER